MAQSEGHLFCNSFSKCRPCFTSLQGSPASKNKRSWCGLGAEPTFMKHKVATKFIQEENANDTYCSTQRLTFVEVFLFFLFRVPTFHLRASRSGSAVQFYLFFGMKLHLCFCPQTRQRKFHGWCWQLCAHRLLQNPQIKCKWAQNLRAAQRECGMVWVSGSGWKTAARHPLFVDWTPVAVMIQHICGL